MSKSRNKTKNKERLDTYFYKAKEENYRSRAAFKLIQLNQKFDFLKDCKSIIDLCAAPGGWLQVCRRFSAPMTNIIGVDLNRIPHIPNVKTFVGDITHRKTFRQMRHLMYGKKADLILHDGSPNMGQSWIQDAYTQNELVLASIKFCTELLTPGGCFVTKIFRSRDYTSLLFVMNQFFDLVESSKPVASRNTSAEMYVICKGYKNPKFIDPNLLSPNSVFKETNKPKKSLKAYLKFEKDPKKRNREGYEEDYTIFYKSCSIKDFILTQTPIHLLMEMYEFVFNEFDGKDSLENAIRDHPLTTEEIRKLCEDLKLIGRHDFRMLMKYRRKLRHHFKIEEADETLEDGEGDKNSVIEPPPKDISELDEEDIIDELNDIQKKNKRRDRRTLERTIVRRRGKMPLPDDLFEKGSEDLLYQNELGFHDSNNLFNLQKLERGNGETKGDTSSLLQHNLDDVTLDQLQPLFEQERREQKDVQNKILSELHSGKKYLYGNDYDAELEKDMNAFLEHQYRKEMYYLKGMGLVKGKEGEHSDLGVDDQDASFHPQQRMSQLDKQIEEERKMLLEAMAMEKEEDIEKMKRKYEESLQQRKREQQLRRRKKKQTGDSRIDDQMVLTLKDEFKEDEEENEDDEDSKNDMNLKKWFASKGSLFEDDLVSKVMNSGMSNQEEEEKGMVVEGYDNDNSEFESSSKKRKLNSGEKQSSFKMNVDDDDDEQEELPSEMYNPRIGPTTLSLAKKFLKDKKERRKWIDGAYNRYAHNDVSQMPSWFQKDFNENTQREVPLTKEELEVEKEKWAVMNSRPIRKVAEAQERKRRKNLQKKRNLVHRANRIAQDTEITNQSKISQLNRLYKSFNKRNQRKKVYKTPGEAVKRKRGAKVVFVDNRMKKDKRNKKNKKKQ